MKGSRSGFLYKVWDILMPFVIYYAVYLLSFFLLSCFCQSIVGKSGVEIAALLQEQRATLTGIVNGIGMLLGALVLLPLLRVELQEHHGRITSYGQQDTLGLEEGDRCRNGQGWGEKRQKGSVPTEGRREERKSAAQTIGIIWITVILALSSSIGLNVLLSLTGFVQNSASYQEVAQSQYGVAFGVGVFLYAVVSPVAEEIVFRGIIYNRMRRYLSEWQDGRAYRPEPAGHRSGAGMVKGQHTTGGAKRQMAGYRRRMGEDGFDATVTVSVIASAVLFGVYHGNLVQGVYGCCMGILMAYMYERTHAFYIPCIFHAAANCVVYVLAQNAALHSKIFTFPWCVGLLAASLVLLLIVEKGWRRAWVEQ